MAEARLTSERVTKFQVGYPILLKKPYPIPRAPNTFMGWDCEVTDETDDHIVLERREEPEYIIR